MTTPAMHVHAKPRLYYINTNADGVYKTLAKASTHAAARLLLVSYRSADPTAQIYLSQRKCKPN